MRYFLILASLFLAAWPAFGDTPTATTQREWRPTPEGGHFVYFYDPARFDQTQRWTAREFDPRKLPAPPATFDFGPNISYPMYGNDQYGDCFYASICHHDQTLTGAWGSPSQFDLKAIVSRYLFLSQGDNGLADQDVQGEWKNRYLADVQAAKIVDYLYIDVTNPAAIDAGMYFFGGTQFTFTVPSAWINNSNAGFVWDASNYSANQNGHAVYWRGKTDKGYLLVTWGVTGTITPAAVRVCNPDGFVVFSTRWFDAKGYAPNKKHITELAPMWVSAGGKAIPPIIISQFPPPGDVPPIPTPGGGQVIIQIPGLSDQVFPFNVPSSGGKTVPDATPQVLIDAIRDVFKSKKQSEEMNEIDKKKKPVPSINPIGVHGTKTESYRSNLDEDPKYVQDALAGVKKDVTDLKMRIDANDQVVSRTLDVLEMHAQAIKRLSDMLGSTVNSTPRATPVLGKAGQTPRQLTVVHPVFDNIVTIHAR